MEVTAVRLVEHGAPLRIEKVELPQPGPDEVLVEMAFGSVNPVDRYGALGLTATDGPLPRTLGTEGSGTVDGSAVLVHGSGVGTGRDGLWASAAVVPRKALTPVPEGVELEQAASAGVAGATAWRVVTEIAKVTKEDRLLVLGASGGVGSMIISLCRSEGATSVVGQTAEADNRDWLSRIGATDVVVVSGSAELADQVGELAPTVVFDALGDGFTGQAIASMANHGRLVIFGSSAGTSGELPLLALYRKGITVFGYAGLLASEEELARAKRRAMQAIAERRMHVEIGARFPIERANEAFECLAARKVRGKLVLDLRD